MEKFRLIGMSDFVLEQNYDGNSTQKYLNELQLIHNYANFLKQPLKLEMFVTCDDEGNVLEEPLREHFYEIWDYKNELHFYNEARNKVLFYGFELRTNQPNNYVTNGCFYPLLNNSDKTIGDLVNHNLTLTQSALKQIGL